MLTYVGKYTTARVMVDEIDEETVSQIYRMINHPAFAGTNPVFMPDLHAGNGAVIGTTVNLTAFVIPNIVGVDIGCGMDAVRLEGVNRINFEELDARIKRIPHGFGKYPEDKNGNDKPYHKNEAIVTDYIEGALVAAHRTGSRIEDVICSLGTLGGGNHFIEIDKDPDGNFWLVVHTGSRNFGLKVCSFYQKKAKELLAQTTSGDAYSTMEYMPATFKYAKEYIEDMMAAQRYAVANRLGIVKNIVERYFNLNVEDCAYIQSIHNYISPTDLITRKGAIAAYEGQKVIIPLNMRDGTIIGTGKGNKDWNYSAPHGAGRIMSRKKAKESIAVPDFKIAMEGIYTSCVCAGTVDESPMAYKDKDLIINAIGDTVDIDFIMKPVYNFKASNE